VRRFHRKAILHSPFSTGHKGVSHFLHGEAILLAALFLILHSPFSEEVWQPLMWWGGYMETKGCWRGRSTSPNFVDLPRTTICEV
jgi:hypothetical protein